MYIYTPTALYNRRISIEYYLKKVINDCHISMKTAVHGLCLV